MKEVTFSSSVRFPELQDQLVDNHSPATARHDNNTKILRKPRIRPKKSKLKAPNMTPIGSHLESPSKAIVKKYPLMAKKTSSGIPPIGVIPKEFVRWSDKMWIPKEEEAKVEIDFSKIRPISSYFRVFYKPHTGPSIAKTYQYLLENNLLKMPF